MGCSEGTCSRRWVWNLDRLCKKCSVEGGGEFGTESSRSTWRRRKKRSEDTDSKQAGWQILQILPCKTEQLNGAQILRKGGVMGDWSEPEYSNWPHSQLQQKGRHQLPGCCPVSKQRQLCPGEGTSLTKDTELHFHNPHTEWGKGATPENLQGSVWGCWTTGEEERQKE